MKNRLLLLLLVLFILPFNMKAEWLTIDKNKTANTPPKVSILSDDNSSTVLKIDISGFDFKEFTSDGRAYQSIDLLSEILTNEPGSPELPYIAKVLAIPDRSGISIEVIETGEIQVFTDVNLPPARESWIQGEAEPSYQENAAVYQSDNIYPKTSIEVEEPSVFRDFRIARVSVFPVRYIPGKKELQVVSSITVKVSYGRGEVVNPRTASNKAIAPSFAKLYKSFIYNYQNVLDRRYGGREDGREMMLCIMPDELKESFLLYADWKRQSGTDVHVTQFSDINANASNPEIIKEHITDAYFNWENPPTYVLIVGDRDVFPYKTVTYPDYSFPNEDHFVEVEGNDFFPEMMIGRFTNQGDYRMRVMINKFMLYEQNPYTEETDWFKKATCCSNNAYESQVSTVRFAANRLREEGGFEVDTLMSDGSGWGGQGCSMDLDDVVATLNEGRSFLNYRGEGWYSGWQATCYNFSTNDVSSLNNGQKFTFITSIGCGVAAFQSSGGNCFGEEWVQLGSLSEPRGGCAFIGPTSNTHTTYNNKIDKGIYVGMFREGMDTPGQALLRGKLYMYNVFGADYYCEYHYQVFCILGDPSLHIWKEVPLEINASHVASIPVGNDQVEVDLTFASSGLPVANAEVCITGAELFITAVSDSTGKALLDITPILEEELTITVRGGNVIPYQGTIEVTQPEELIEPDGFPIVVDLDGNTDGLVNPNENCSITFTLKNWGVILVNNVQATITSSDENVEIVTTSAVSYGNMNPGGTYTGEPFQFYVKPECPIGSTLTFQLHVTSTVSAWDYTHTLDVMGCELAENTCMVHEVGTTDVNYKMDPGETVELFLLVQNIGQDDASDVVGVLSSNDPYITIQDAEGSFGTIEMNGEAVNSEDYFMLSIDASCPTDYMAEFSLELNTTNGNYPYQMVQVLNLPVGLTIPTDYTGPDAYGYYAYSNQDAFYDQTPDYDWMEIEGLGTALSVPADVSDYTQTVNLPFTFTYYGADFNQIRISTDGWIAMGSGTQTAPVNAVLPHNDNVNNMVAAFWDDLWDVSMIDADVSYYADNDNHRFIIEWDSITHNNFAGEPVKESFQAILLDPAHYLTNTGDGEIILQYKNVQETESMTIGIENAAQVVGLQYVFDNAYDASAFDLSNETAIKITTEAPFVSVIVSIDDDQSGQHISNGIQLEQNFPNPFSSETRISYSLSEGSNVSLEVFNIRGELVCSLQSAYQSAGKYSIMWNGANDLGNQVGSGVYFYRLQTENAVEAMKLFRLK